ncbi:MAG TPA: c-type cytochrome [Thermoanaerobaculia bacterium]
MKAATGLWVLVPLVAAAPGLALETERPRMPAPELYKTACASCHGADGKGAPGWEGRVPLPDFSDCIATTSEPAEQWETIVRDGGRSRGLSSTMPAFGEALRTDEIRDLVVYLRAFCANAAAYPPGDLNFRRPLETGKAFPEQEAVVSSTSTRVSGRTTNEIDASFENRIGPRFQYEATVPFFATNPEPGNDTGIGDVELEAKYVLHFDVARSQILSAGVGLTFPTGSVEKGTGEGAFAAEPFLAFGKAWGETILQARAATEISAKPDRRASVFGYQLALSQALGPPHIAWTPAVEIVGEVRFKDGVNETAAIFEVSKAISPLGHIVGSIGVRVPLTQSDEKYRIEAFLLWDFGDGPFWKGW